MTPLRHRFTTLVHPSVRRQVAEWLEEAAQDASDSAVYTNPYLAQAFRSLAESVRQQAGSPHRGSTTNDRRPTQ